MNNITVILGGMSDRPTEQLEGKTPLEAADTPYIDYLFRQGKSGYQNTCNNIPCQFAAMQSLDISTDNIDNLSRASFEAAYFGIKADDEAVVLCCTFVSLSDDGDYEDKTMFGVCSDITDHEAEELIAFLAEKLNNDIFTFCQGMKAQHILLWKKGEPHPGTLFSPYCSKRQNVYEILPQGNFVHPLYQLMVQSNELLKDHPLNIQRMAQGKNSINSVWLWEPGKMPRGIHTKKGTLVSDDLMMCGMAVSAKMKTVDTNQLAQQALKELENGCRSLYIYTKLPRDYSLLGDVTAKKKCLEKVDKALLKPIFDFAVDSTQKYTLKVMSDCSAVASLGCYCKDPVPYAEIVLPSRETIDNIIE